MAEITPDVQSAIAQALQGAMAQMKQMQAPTQAPVAAAPSLGIAPAAQSFGVPALTGWSVPVEQEINGMTVTLYLNFPAETFAQAANIIVALYNSGLQVRAFQKNNGGFGSNNGGGYNRSGGFGGGFSRGGGYGRRW